MNNLYTCIIGLCCLALPSDTLWAQSPANVTYQRLLNIEDVLTAVEENNFDLKSARQNIEAAKALTSKYNRGYMPTLNLSGGVAYNLNGVKSVFNFNFPDLDIQNIQSLTGNINISSSYLLYDGVPENYGMRRIFPVLTTLIYN